MDLSIEIEKIDTQVVEEIELLKPFGQDNKKPLVKIESVYPDNSKIIGADRSHFKTTLHKNEKQVDMIAFNRSEWLNVLKSSPEIGVIGYISINEWNGFKKVQLQAIDYKSKRPVIIDQRKSTLNENMFKFPSTHFIFFQKKVAQKLIPLIDGNSSYQIVDKEESLIEIPDDFTVIVVDIPEDLNEFISIYNEYQSHPMHLYFNSPVDYYLSGMPKKQDFQKLYKWLIKKQEIILSKDSREMVRIMNKDKHTIKFMLMVFLENKFVTMEDGKLSVVSNPEKKPLENTLTYKKRLKQIEAEKILVYSSFKELLAYLKDN